MGRLSVLSWRQYLAPSGSPLEHLVFALRSPSGSLNYEKLQVPSHLPVPNMVYEGDTDAHSLGIYLK